jgi:hypothetical protein
MATADVILTQVTMAFTPASVEQFMVWGAYTFAMVVYGVLIWHFYRFASTRDLFAKDLTIYAPGLVGAVEKVVFGLLRLLKYGIFFPIISFVWFFGFSVLLFMMAQNQTVDHIILIAIALISATRVLAYYNENHARDFAKLIPFAILGVFLVQPDFFSFEQLIERLKVLPQLSTLLLQFIVYLSVLEIILRVLLQVKIWLFGPSVPESKEAE